MGGHHIHIVPTQWRCAVNGICGLYLGFCVIQADLAPSPSNLGNRLAELGRPAEALRAEQEAVAIWRELVATANRARLAYMVRYSDEELSEWAPRIQGLAGEAEVTQVLFSNCYSDWAHRNGQELETLVS